MIKQIFSASLRIGMYISKLDRPWTETPFVFQGFSIKTQEDIDTLRNYCTFVYIDTEKDATVEKRIPTRHLINNLETKVLPKRSKEYKIKTKVEAEIKNAKNSYKSLAYDFSMINKQLAANETLNIIGLEKAVKSMVQSIARNPDAFLLLSKLKLVDHHHFNHSLSCSVLAVAFGRHMGLSPRELVDLGMGVLLCDVGVTKLPPEILRFKGQLNGDQHEIYKTHVEHSVNMLRQAKGINREILKLIQFHHERHNGSGYPNRVIGLQIPALARMASVVDYFQSLTTPPPQYRPLNTMDAINHLNECRDTKFQREMVDSFVQSLGIFATGSIVELSSGEVGFVMAQNSIKKLRPKVMLVLNKNKENLGHLPIIDLANEEFDSNNQLIKISKLHEPFAFNIDVGSYL